MKKYLYLVNWYDLKFTTLQYTHKTFCHLRKVDVQIFSTHQLSYCRAVSQIIIKTIGWTTANLTSVVDRIYEGNIRYVILQAVSIEYLKVRPFDINSFEKTCSAVLFQKNCNSVLLERLHLKDRVFCSSSICCEKYRMVVVNLVKTSSHTK